MDSEFKLLAAGFVNKGGTIDRIAPEFGRQRNRSDNFGAVSNCRVDNLFGLIVNQTMVVRFYFQPQF